MAEMMTSPSSTVIIALTKSETESLVTALRFCQVDGDLPENLEGILSRMYTYAVEVYNYGS